MEDPESPRRQLELINKHGDKDPVDVINICRKLRVNDAAVLINHIKDALLTDHRLLANVLEDHKLQEPLARTSVMADLLGPSANTTKLAPHEVSTLMSLPLKDVFKELSTNPQNREAIFRLRKADFGTNPHDILKLLQHPNPDPKEASAVLQKNQNYLGQHPALLAMVLKAPTLEKAVEQSNLVENLTGKKSNLDRVAAAVALTDEADATGQLRTLRNHVVSAKYFAVPNELNPKKHGRDSPETLSSYLINTPEVASHFLSQKSVQKQFFEKPPLLARMIVEGNGNLRRTMQETGALNHPNSGTKESLDSMMIMRVALESEPLDKSKHKTKLLENLKDLYRTIEEKDGKNIATLREQLSSTDVQQLRSTVLNKVMEATRESTAKAKRESIKEAAPQTSAPTATTGTFRRGTVNPVQTRRNDSVTLGRSSARTRVDSVRAADIKAVQTELASNRRASDTFQPIKEGSKTSPPASSSSSSPRSGSGQHSPYDSPSQRTKKVGLKEGIKRTSSGPRMGH